MKSESLQQPQSEEAPKESLEERAARLKELGKTSETADNSAVQAAETESKAESSDNGKKAEETADGPKTTGVSAEQTIEPESETESLEEGEKTKETADDSEKDTKKAEITQLSERIKAIDAEIAALKGSLDETREQLGEVRKSLGLENPEAGSAATEAVSDEKIKQLLEVRQQLAESSAGWIQANGREELPEGIDREIDDETTESKEFTFDRNYENRFPNLKEAFDKLKETFDRLIEEIKKAYVEEMKKETVSDFEKALRRSFRYGSAKNIDQVISLMKIRVPHAIDKKCEGFIKGDTKEPPFSAIWIRCKSTTLFETLAGKPNFIKKLDITFDDEVVNLGEDEALGVKTEEMDRPAEQEEQPQAEQSETEQEETGQAV